MLDTGDLEAFVEAARYGTFSAAATRLCTTQPSLSRRIARLEHELGGPLFDRSNRRSPHLAPLGELLLADARQLLADQARFEDMARDFREGRTGTVVVVVSEATAELALPTLYRLVEQGVPDIQLRVIERTPGPAIRDALLEREAEVGFLGGMGLVPALDSLTFGVTDHIAVGRPRYLGATEDPIEWDELRRMPLLLAVKLEQIVYPRGLEPINVVHQGGYPGLLRTMARAEMGVTILGGVRQSDGLVCRPIADDGRLRRSNVQLAWVRGGLMGSATELLLGHLRARFERARPPVLVVNEEVDAVATHPVPPAIWSQ